MTRDHWHGLLRFGPCLEDTDGTLAEPPRWAEWERRGGNPKTAGEWQARRIANRGVAVRFEADRVRAMQPPPAEPCTPADLAAMWARIRTEARRARGGEMTRLMQGAALALLDLSNAALLIWIFAHGTLARAVLLDYPR